MAVFATAKEWAERVEQVWARDRGICQLCFKPIGTERAHIDHILPFSKGGRDELDNLRLTHSTCNVSRGNGDNYAPTLYARIHDEPVLTGDILSPRAVRLLRCLRAGWHLRQITTLTTTEGYEVYKLGQPTRRYGLNKVLIQRLRRVNYIAGCNITEGGLEAIQRDAAANIQREASKGGAGRLSEVESAALLDELVASLGLE